MSLPRFPISPFSRAAFLAILAPALFSGASLMAAPPDAHPSNAHPLPGYAIVRLGRGHFNRMDFVARIDGVEGLMFVDTGAVHTVLNAAKYDFLLKSGAKRPAGVPAGTHINEISVPVAIAKDVQIGEVRLADVPFPLVAERYLYDQVYRGASDQQYDGFFGENVLRHYNAVVDCGRLALYLNTDPRHKLDLSHALTQAGWTQIPMSNAGTDFTVPCTLGGHPYRLLVDTGSPFTVFDQGILYKEDIPQVDVPMKAAIIGYVPKEVKFVRADTLQIGSYVATGVHPLGHPDMIHNMKLAKAAEAGPPIAGILGGDVLANNAAMIDIGNHNLYLKH
jgi:hypothetical protein